VRLPLNSGRVVCIGWGSGEAPSLSPPASRSRPCRTQVLD